MSKDEYYNYKFWDYWIFSLQSSFKLHLDHDLIAFWCFANRLITSDNGNELKKVILKGVAAVDSECHELVDTAHVYAEFSDVYDALLNQVELLNTRYFLLNIILRNEKWNCESKSKKLFMADRSFHVWCYNMISVVLFQTSAQYNNNKYFIIQLLESDVEKRYWVWFRWGRVGYKVCFYRLLSDLSMISITYYCLVVRYKPYNILKGIQSCQKRTLISRVIWLFIKH